MKKIQSLFPKRLETLYPENVVSMIQDGKIRVDHVSPSLERGLLALGGKSVIEGGEIWTIPYEGKLELAKLLDRLNQIGVLFQYDHSGWPPSDIFQDLREKGLLQGSFKEVYSTGPGKVFTRIRRVARLVCWKVSPRHTRCTVTGACP